MSGREPAPLGPLGPTDSYAFANGVIVYFDNQQMERKHHRTVVIHGGADQCPTRIPADLYGVIYAVCFASGLSVDEASLVREAAENHA
jgi:hypothetical protein